ncbi:hypothetical protein PR048_020176 [Dryococelus australis]|uniref:Integrase catalytic domain-containing protein n=1 Tax=Dryococelus australis TaxID=614101 RepID=A0ABQ9H5L7_9NEOP|nr:hypothetical protein PR048_020176 [Dryococelus australis]
MAKQTQNSKVGAYSVKLPSRLWERVFTDAYGSLHRSNNGKNCILILVDGFSKYALLLLLCDMKAVDIVKAFLNRVWKVFGCTKQLTCAEHVFFNHVFNHVITSPYYPCHSLVERLNKNVEIALNENLPELNLASISVLHSATGYLPSKNFNWGGNSHFLCSIRKTCLNVYKARRNVESKYNSDRVTNNYQVGDLVACHHYAHSKKAEHFSLKLTILYVGPYKILRFIGPITDLLGDPENDFILKRQIKLFCSPSPNDS